MGTLAELGSTGQAELRRAMLLGTVMASFNIESFSLDRFESLERADVEARAEIFREMMRL